MTSPPRKLLRAGAIAGVCLGLLAGMVGTWFWYLGHYMHQHSPSRRGRRRITRNHDGMLGFFLVHMHIQTTGEQCGSAGESHNPYRSLQGPAKMVR